MAKSEAATGPSGNRQPNRETETFRGRPHGPRRTVANFWLTGGDRTDPGTCHTPGIAEVECEHAKLARVAAPGVPHHITQPGSHRQTRLFCEDDCVLGMTFGGGFVR
jgi:hypothetical protein